MDYIAENVKDRRKRKAGRKAICPDLTDDEIQEYARLVAEDRKEMDNDVGRPQTVHERALELLNRNLNSSRADIKSYNQAMKLVLMHDALGEIDDTVDWETPKRMGISRNFERGPKALQRSVVLPGWAAIPLYEASLTPDAEIDRDCDQVRAMIKVFCDGWGEWSLDEFREALGSSVTRDRLDAFLRKRGTDGNQLKSAAFILSWEFFNRRQQLGLPIRDVYIQDDLKFLREAEESSKVTREQVNLQKAHFEAKKKLKKGHEHQSKNMAMRHLAEKAELESTQERQLQEMKHSQTREMGALRLREAQAARLAKTEEEALSDHTDHTIEVAPLAESSSGKLNRKRPSGGGDGGRAKRATRSS
jgi:hypothetical protein